MRKILTLAMVTVLIGCAVFNHFRMHLPWIDLILLCGPGAILGQLGDLCESLMKRSRGVKDSGSNITMSSSRQATPKRLNSYGRTSFAAKRKY